MMQSMCDVTSFLSVADLALCYQFLKVGCKRVSCIIVKNDFNGEIEYVWTQCRWKIWIVGKSYGVFFGCYYIFVSCFYVLKARRYEVEILSREIMMIGKHLDLDKRSELFDISYERLWIGDSRYDQQAVLVTEVLKVRYHPGIVREYRL